MSPDTDRLIEAGRILRGETRMLPTEDHLRAVVLLVAGPQNSAAGSRSRSPKTGPTGCGRPRSSSRPFNGGLGRRHVWPPVPAGGAGRGLQCVIPQSVSRP